MTPTELMYHQAKGQHRRAVASGLIVSTRRVERDSLAALVDVTRESGADVAEIGGGR